MATFSDPSPSGAVPLFTWDMNAKTLAGSWTIDGLTLEHPGFIGGGQTADTRFVMDPVTLTEVIPNQLYDMGPGKVRFYTTDINNPIFVVSFAGGRFLNPLNAGGADSSGHQVAFSGPSVPGDLFNEAFSFSFANPVVGRDTVTYTASFTSSADIIPEPGTLLALGVGVAALLRRRKA